MTNCVIVVPIYKETPTFNERKSLEQLFNVLGGFDIYLMTPNGLNVDEYKKMHEELYVAEFDKYFFDGRLRYGELMNKADFYKYFNNKGYEYMLVYQPDCWVFKNELQAWCDKGYDYVGAPFFIKWFADRNLFVGNGGFSLRRLSAMIDYTTKFSGKGLPHDGTDDGFFAANFDKSLKIPTKEEAALFSLETFPREQYEVTKTLPFGCHAYKRYDWAFWKPFIGYDALDFKNEVTFCILTYKESENAKKWYNTFKDTPI